METEKDNELWRLAKKRVAFKRHLATYLIMNSLFWCLWLLSNKHKEGDLPWPIWPMLGWGIGLAFDFAGTYVFNKHSAIEKEYEKLKNK